MYALTENFTVSLDISRTKIEENKGSFDKNAKMIIINKINEITTRYSQPCKKQIVDRNYSTTFYISTMNEITLFLSVN